jgi:hypothetical protein
LIWRLLPRPLVPVETARRREFPPPGDGFCKDWQVDQGQEHELRTWAEALCRSTESERRAMGKAIVMLLGEIERLKETVERPQPLSFDVVESAMAVPAQLPDGSADACDDTVAINLRKRLGAVMHRHRD